jgi:DNA polymerase I-like protein with 3'-5' exonuclease and polymerase domains
MHPKTAAVDFETFYQKSRYSTQIQGPRGYVDHPEFDAYMVSIATSDGGEFVGHPSEFDFHDLDGYAWLSHNRGFDFLVYQKLLATGKTTGPKDPEWHCTADLAAYLGYPRALAQVLAMLYGVSLDKGVRDRMSGQKWESMSPQEQEDVRNYAMEDVRYLNRFWQDYGPIWPEHERRISDLTLRMKNAGLPIDDAKLDQSIKTLRQKLFDLEEAIPWFDRSNPKEKAKTPLSPKAMAEECLKIGLPVPSSRAKASAAAQAWLEEYGDQAPFVRAMGEWNSVNSLLQKLTTLRERIIFPEEDDFAYQHLPAELRNGQTAWCPYGLKYFGAHTGRDSGGEGLNVLNMHRGSVAGIDFRSHIVAPAGFKFVSADYSQIEPRVLAWLAEDDAFLDAVRSGIDPYVAFGIHTLGHLGDWNKQDRQVWKMMVLSLGYQAGGEKFQGAAKSMGGLELTLEEAKDLVRLYRRKNKKVADRTKGFWALMENELRRQSKTAGGSGTATVTLPSERTITYRNVVGRSNLTADLATEAGYRKSHIYGGLATENVVQACSRDIFFDGYLGIAAAGLSVVLRIYDEFLILVREEEAENARHITEQIMGTPPEWAADLPVAAEAEIIDIYTK